MMDLCREFSLYVSHAAILQKRSRFYNENSFCNSLVCLQGLSTWLSKATQPNMELELAKLILKHKEHMMTVLPYPSNVSYRNSLKRCMDMFEYSRLLVDGKVAQKPDVIVITEPVVQQLRLAI